MQLQKLMDLRDIADCHLQDIETLDRNWRDNYRKACNFADFILDSLPRLIAAQNAEIPDSRIDHAHPLSVRLSNTVQGVGKWRITD